MPVVIYCPFYNIAWLFEFKDKDGYYDIGANQKYAGIWLKGEYGHIKDCKASVEEHKILLAHDPYEMGSL